MGNLLGEPFDKYVNEQIRARQRLHGASNRSTRDLQYLNSRNAWIKLASGCLLDQRRVDMLKGNPLITGKDDSTAKSNVLFNGLSNNNGSQRSGITGTNRAYGVGGTDQFGYSPMPGITDMDFKCLNRGSIKKATLNIKAHNKNQFDMIDVLYLRLGYSVMLEWGYDKYINNKGTLVQQGPTLIDEWFFTTNNKHYRDAILKIQQKRKETFGNYDAAFGVISNFSWTFEADGTYNIKLEIISMGDVIESLKVNLPSVLTDTSGTLGQTAIKRYAALLESKGGETVSQSEFYGALYPGLQTALRNWWEGVQTGSYKTGISDAQQMKLPNIEAGIDFPENWTGRDDIDVNGDPTKDDNKTYGSDWIYGYGETPQDRTTVGIKTFQGENSSSVPKLYNSDGTVYTNSDIAQIDGSFKLDDEKLKAVWAGVNNIWQAGIATSTNGNRPIEDIESPFGDDFVRNMRGPLRNLDVPNNNNKEGTGDTNFTMTHFIPYPVNGQYSDTNLTEVFITYVSQGFAKSNNVRKQWTDLFKEIKSRSNADAWKFLLDNEYKGVNFSNAIGISGLSQLYTKVYEEFKKRNLADAVPPNPELESKLEELDEKSQEGELSDADKRTQELTQQKLDRTVKDYITKNKNRIYRIFYDLRKEWGETDPGKLNEGEPINLFPGEVQGSKGNIGLAFDGNKYLKLNIEPLDNQWFIRLGTFFEILNNQIIPKIDNNGREIPMITLDTSTKDNICYVMDNTYSLDLSKILVQNQHFISGIDSSGNPVTNPIFPKLPRYVNLKRNSIGGLAWGNIMNIYFNFNRLEEIFDSTQAKDTVSLYNALKAICEDINECLGGINQLEPVIDEDNIVRFIDQTNIPNLDMIALELGIEDLQEKFSLAAQQREVKFEVYGLNYSKAPTESNFVRNIGLTTQISKNYATMITIGATANGSIPGTEATAFSRWNIGIKDRFKNQIIDPTEKNSPVAPISSSAAAAIQQEYSEMIASQDDVFNRYGLSETSDDLKTLNSDFVKYNSNIAADFYKLMQAQSSFEVDEENNQPKAIESSVGFIPFNLQLEMDGLSGIKIYNRIKVTQNFLPSNYEDTLEFIITQVNHKLSGNDWVTSLETTATSKSVMSK